MSELDIRAQLEAAREFQVAQISDAERDIVEAKRGLSKSEERLAVWSKMTPFQVQQAMVEMNERQAADERRVANQQRLNEIHEAAMYQAREHQKGILLPEAVNKSTTFSFIGAGIGGLLLSYVFWYHFEVKNELALLVSVLIGGVAGLFCGSVFFDANFVVDDSLEGPLFGDSSARDAVRRTYFKDQ